MNRVAYVGVSLDTAGNAVVCHGGEFEQWNVGFPSDDGTWPALSSVLSTLRTRIAESRAQIRFCLERPLVQVKILPLKGLRISDVEQLIGRSSDTFFPSRGPNENIAAAHRVGRSLVIGAVAPQSLVSICVRAAHDTGFECGGVLAAGLCGALQLKPARGLEYRVLLLLSSSLELVWIRRGRVIRVRSARVAAPASGYDNGQIVSFAAQLLGDPSGPTPVICGGPPNVTAQLAGALREFGHPIAERTSDPLDGHALAALGAASARPPRIPVINTPEMRARTRAVRKRKTRFGTAVALAVVVLFAAAYRTSLLHDLARIEEQRFAIRSDVSRSLRARAEIAGMNRLADAAEQIAARRVSAVRMIGSITAVVPDGAHLTSLSFDSTSIRLSGRALSAPALVPAFERQAWVRSARLGSTLRRERTPTGVQDHFSMIVELAQEGKQ